MTTSTTTPSSRISGFHKLDVPARIDAVARFEHFGVAAVIGFVGVAELAAGLVTGLVLALG